MSIGKNILFISYDNDSYIHYFPIGIAYLASVLKNLGHTVTIYNQDVYHYTEEQLKHYIESNSFDIVGIGMVAGYYQYNKILDISKAINSCNNRNKFIYLLGGHLVSAAPEYFLEKTQADIATIGEAEETIKDIVEFKDRKTIDGIAYREKNKYFVTNKRGPILDLDSISRPLYELFPIDYYKLQRFPEIKNSQFSMSMVTGRGCNYHCTFCYRTSKGYRLKSIQNIVDELLFLKKTYDISYIDFADDLTMASKQRMVELCEAFLKNDLNIQWRCEGRLNYLDLELLNIMKKAGCVFINYGIESLNEDVLKHIKKGLNKDIIIKGIELTISAKMHPGLNFMWGNIGDNVDTLNEMVDFLMKYDTGSQIRTLRPVTPYPGCELFETALKLGKVKDVRDFYENKHKNSDLFTINFMDIDTETAYKALYEANTRLLKYYYNNKLNSNSNALKNLYFKKDVDFRGFRHT